MTDRELESRLRTHLHRRFDAAQPPAELMASVQQAIGTPRRHVGLQSFRAGLFRPGWTAIAAVLGIALVLLAAPRYLPEMLGPGSDPSPTPAEMPAKRQFLVVPPASYEPDKTDSDLASAVLEARLRALLFVGDQPNGFTGAVGNGITFTIPPGGPSDQTVAAVLRATGDLAIVPLPIDDYGTEGDIGDKVPVVGEPLPTDAPALFGWDGIESFTADTDQQGRRMLLMKLRPAAAQAFGDYTSAHVGEFFAILIDGDVVAAPSINEPITDGQGQLSLVALDGAADAADVAAMAVLLGGRMPEAWRNHTVPDIKPVQEIVDQVMWEFAQTGQTGAFVSADLDVIYGGEIYPGWVGVWRIMFEGDLTGDCTINGVSEPPGGCPRFTRYEVVADVSTGGGYSGGYLP